MIEALEATAKMMYTTGGLLLSGLVVLILIRWLQALARDNDE